MDPHHRQTDDSCSHSNMLTYDEHLETKPSLVSSWHLQPGMYPVLTSRHANDDCASQGLGVSASVLRGSPTWSQHYPNPPHVNVREWVAHLQANPPPPLSKDSNYTEGVQTMDFWASALHRPSPTIPPPPMQTNPQAQAREEASLTQEPPPHLHKQHAPQAWTAPPSQGQATREQTVQMTTAGEGRGNPSSLSPSSLE